jgi:hypothetical protein
MRRDGTEDGAAMLMGEKLNERVEEKRNELNELLQTKLESGFFASAFQKLFKKRSILEQYVIHVFNDDF